MIEQPFVTGLLFGDGVLAAMALVAIASILGDAVWTAFRENRKRRKDWYGQ